MGQLRYTTEDGKIQVGCKNCNHGTACKVFGGKCELIPGINLNYVFHLGKHKGKTLGQVIDEDTSYVLWMVANVKWFTLHRVAREIFMRTWPDLVRDMEKAEVAYESKFISNQTEEDDINRKNNAIR